MTPERSPATTGRLAFQFLRSVRSGAVVNACVNCRTDDSIDRQAVFMSHQGESAGVKRLEEEKRQF